MGEQEQRAVEVGEQEQRVVEVGGQEQRVKVGEQVHERECEPVHEPAGGGGGDDGGGLGREPVGQ